MNNDNFLLNSLASLLKRYNNLPFLEFFHNFKGFF